MSVQLYLLNLQACGDARLWSKVMQALEGVTEQCLSATQQQGSPGLAALYQAEFAACSAWDG